MRRIKDWDPEGNQLFWTYDLASQTFYYAAGWFNGASVSAVKRQKDFKTPKQAAESSASCDAHSDYYKGLTGVEQVFSKPIQVDGRPGHWVRIRARIDEPELLPGIKGDVVDVVVVDTGDPNEFSMFLASSTIGDKKTLSTMEELIKGLRVVS